MHPRSSCCLLAACAAAASLLAWSPAFAGWPSTPDINVPACTAANDQGMLQSTSDGDGGVILAWADDRPGSVGIYVQRITAYGTPAWAPDGVRIYTPPLGAVLLGRWPDAGAEETSLRIVSDGAGGAIVAWKDTVGPDDTDILAQRVGRTGAILWDPAGVAICRAEGRQTAPTLVSDGAGGGIVAWEDHRAGAMTVRAQRVTASGGCAWTTDGVLASSAAESYGAPGWSWICLGVASDEAGGAIVTWASARGIVAQRLDPAGAALWSPDGVAVRPHERVESQPQVVSDGLHGAFFTWGDYWNGGSGVHAQHVDAAGNVLWGARGVAVCDGWYDSWNAHLAPDGQGGSIIVWQDTRPNYCGPCNGSVLYAQRLDRNGTALWAPSGILVSDPTRGSGAQNMRLNSQVIPDGSGGALFAYTLNVSGDAACSAGSIYLQRVAPEGTRAWANDVALSCVAANQGYPVLVPSQAGAAIVAWEDRRNGNGDIYAQRVAADGRMHAPVTFTDIGAGLPTQMNGRFVWGDYDNDGDLDLLCSSGPGNTGPRIYRNDAGTFVDIGASLPPYGYMSAAWGDFDNDGWLDVLLDNAIYRNNHDGTFSSLYTSFPYPRGALVSGGDFDADGDLDVLEAGNYGPPHEIPWVTLLRNDGNGVFTSVNAGLEPGPSWGPMWASIAWADYDRDGHLDVLLGASLYHNTGNLWFQRIDVGIPDAPGTSAAWGDYDNDGFPDIAVGGQGVYHNNRDGTFTAVATLPFAAVAWADFDNDGRSDIVCQPTTYPRSGCTIYRNEGGGVFTDIGAGLPDLYSSYWDTTPMGDFDNDGDVDLVAGGVVYRSDGAIANTPPSVPDGPWSIDVSGGDVTLRWTATTDPETPAAALTYNLRVGTTPGGSEIMSPLSLPSSGHRSVVQMGNAGTVTSLQIRPPRSQSQVYWSVQAVDGAYAGSPFTSERFFGPVPTLPCLYTLDAGPLLVRIVWYAAAELPGAATIYRRDAGSDWVALAQASRDGSGYVRYDDSTVQPGERYAYRVGVATGSGQVFSEEVWADVPREVVAFALQRVMPNPSQDGTVSVQFTVPAGPAARLELVDVRGRRVVAQDILGPGRFSVELGRDRRIGAGVYFVRLVQGTQVRVERAIVL